MGSLQLRATKAGRRPSIGTIAEWLLVAACSGARHATRCRYRGAAGANLVQGVRRWRALKDASAAVASLTATADPNAARCSMR